MKNSKFKLSLDTVVKLSVIVALIVGAATKQQYSFYNFLRWLVMIPFIYFCYNSYAQKQFGLLIYFGLISILFNPFQKFWFQKQTWHLIDYLVAGITALTIIYDWFFIIQNSKTNTQKINQYNGKNNRTNKTHFWIDSFVNSNLIWDYFYFRKFQNS